MIRIDKLFSNLGLLSRNDCKKAVKKGEISINGTVCKSADEKIDPDFDKISLNGKIIDSRSRVYYLLNKPKGVISTKEESLCKTVFNLLPDKRTDLCAVGRLDKDTTGILLLTNDGQLCHRLLSPKYHVNKTYRVLIDGVLNEKDAFLLQNGMDIGDEKPTLAAKLLLLDEKNPQTVLLTLCEGRYHQVKRMFEALGKPVLQLHRQSFANIILDENLSIGSYRELTEDEIKALYRLSQLN